MGYAIMAEKLIDRLARGCEVVIVSANENYNSAIFYATRKGEIWSWSREIGDYGPYERGRLAAHFAKMAKGGASLFVRGGQK